MSEPTKSWRSSLAGPAVALLLVACCLAGPLLVGTAGALTVGALLGLAAAAVVLLGLCALVARRIRSNPEKRC
jgi:Na+/proline symporter